MVKGSYESGDLMADALAFYQHCNFVASSAVDCDLCIVYSDVLTNKIKL